MYEDGYLDGMTVVGYDAFHRDYQALWFALLDLGYRVPGFAELDMSVGHNTTSWDTAFFNLLKNALEAMKDGGAITITLASDDETVSVAFRDTGLGMSAEQLAHLFEPYRTTKEKGTGLGLMISKRIVRDHGGTIDAESAVGAGTTFTVRLPRLERRVRELAK